MSEQPRGTSTPDPDDADEGSSNEERTPNTLMNGIVGGIVAIVFFFVPFSTVLGGAVAGYLEGGEHVDGAKVGGIAGVVVLLPVLLLLGVGIVFTPVVVGPGPRASFVFVLIMLFVLVAASLYVVGLSVLGGVIGSYLKKSV